MWFPKWTNSYSFRSRKQKICYKWMHHCGLRNLLCGALNCCQYTELHPFVELFKIIDIWSLYRPLVSKVLQNFSSLKYSWVSFYDSSFYDNSLLRPLSSWTEHSRLVVHHCHNSSVLSLLSALLALLRCARVSSFSILVQFFWVECDFSTHDIHQKDRKEE